MIVVNKNEGTKIPYEVRGTKITFDDDLTINLAKREADDPVHIDVCYDEDKELVIGAAAGRAYVAEVDIPARQYAEIKSETAGDGTDESTSLEAKALNMDDVTLTLWSID
jgi:hypothetical protein